jgi:Tol biopolymer transport system component
VWSPDGDRIAFISKHNGREEIHVAGLDGRADPAATTDDAFKTVWDWSRDGRYIVFGGLSPATGWDLWLLPTSGDRKPVPYLRGSAWEVFASVSPDGRWLAYMSNETGQNEVYVQSFPVPGRKVRVSLDGGEFPRWTDGGRQLEYGAGGERIAVAVEAGEEFQPGSPRKLFTVPRDVTGGASVGDGSRALVSIATGSRPRDIRLVLHWTALLKK